MKKLLCLFSAALLVLTSCSKDDNNDSPTPVPSPILLKKSIFIESDGTTYSEDVVYDRNKIVSMTGDDYVTKYTYTENLITKEEEFDKNGALDFTIEYSYTNGKLTTSTRKKNGADDSTIKFVHNSDGTISYQDFKINTSTGAENNGEYIGKFIFKDGNLIRNEYTYRGVENVITYEYDDKNHPFRDVIGFNLLLNIDPSSSYVNNLIKKSSTSGFISTYAYKYNSDNYPIEEVATYNNPSSPVSVETTQYVY